MLGKSGQDGWTSRPVSVLVNRGNDGTEESIYRVSPSYQEMHQQQHGKRGSICQEFWIFLTRFLVSTGEQIGASVVSNFNSSSNNIQSIKSQGRISLKKSLLGLNLDLKIGDGRGHTVEVVHGVGSE